MPCFPIKYSAYTPAPSNDSKGGNGWIGVPLKNRIVSLINSSNSGEKKTCLDRSNVNVISIICNPIADSTYSICKLTEQNGLNF